ncbi:MAG: 6-phosphofructokinase [Eubacteriales bacterium]|nr:6-phosphofructokinase [Eubacteriales bacterium]
MNILIAQSGGPTAAINASLAGVMKAAFESLEIDKVYGGCNGIQGILEDRIIQLNEGFEGNEESLNRLKMTPAMYLGSCRYKMKSVEEDTADYDRVLEIFRKYAIGAFFYIGGNDSMDTVDKMSKYVELKGVDVKVIGIPKTIDNDLMMIDHTPGFGSAAKYIATSVREIAMDTYIYNMDTVVIVEIMGRNAGWLTAASALARSNYNVAPQLIYLPEVAFNSDDFIWQVKKILFQYHHVIVAVSEGIKDESGKYISAQGTKTDKFGHVMLSGTGAVLKELVAERIGCKVRSIELNVLQRAAAHCASATDLEESFELGCNGVKLALSGKTGVMSTIVRTGDNPYTIEYSSAKIDKIANAEKKIPREWITPEGADVTTKMIEYLRPLIQGEPEVPYKDGLPDYILDRVRRK